MHAMLAWAARVGPWHPSLDHTGPRLAGELPYRPSWESLRHGCAAGDADGRRACGTREARCSWCCWWARRRVPFASSHLPSIVAFHASAGPYHSSTSGRLPPSRASCWSWAPRCSSVPATVPATGQGQRSRRVRGCLAPWPYCPCPRPPRLAAFPSSSASTRPVIRARAGGRVGCLVPSCWLVGRAGTRPGWWRTCWYRTTCAVSGTTSHLARSVGPCRARSGAQQPSRTSHLLPCCSLRAASSSLPRLFWCRATCYYSSTSVLGAYHEV